MERRLNNNFVANTTFYRTACETESQSSPACDGNDSSWPNSALDVESVALLLSVLNAHFFPRPIPSTQTMNSDDFDAMVCETLDYVEHRHCGESFAADGDIASAVTMLEQQLNERLRLRRLRTAALAGGIR